MSDEVNNFLSTQMRSNRPKSTPFRQVEASKEGDSAYQRLCRVKEEMRRTQAAYMQELCKQHQVQRSLQRITRKSLIRRVEFLKIYTNKKYKYLNREQLEGRRKEDERHQRQFCETTKRRKLEHELQTILLRNEEEEHALQLQSRNRQEREMNQREQQQKEGQEMRQARERHSQVKRGQQEYLIRKKNISTYVSMRAKHNYLLKLNQELSMIHEYSGLMDEINNLQLGRESNLELGKDNRHQRPAVRNSCDKNIAFITTGNTIEVHD